MLELKNIYKVYKSGENEVNALRGIDLQFRASDFVSILGPSGCGKTTMLNIIGGLDHYSSGDLVIDGRSTKGYKDRDWDTYRNHSIGFVFQSYNLINSMTALENVEFPLVFKRVLPKKRRKLAKEMLEKVGLGTRLAHKPKEMSGGQQQRVGIARAFVAKPEIVFADEPTGNLDTKTTIEVMELIKQMARDNHQTIVMVTHDRSLAAYADKIIHILDGKIQSIEVTEPDEREDIEERLKEVSQKILMDRGGDAMVKENHAEV